MTVLALKSSRRANAVSSLHGRVSRVMWTPLYPGVAEEQVPIGHITNGVHVPAWLAPQMHRLYDRHFGARLAAALRGSRLLGRDRRRGRWRAVGDASDAQGTADQVRAAPGGRCGRAARRSRRPVSQPPAGLESRRADHRLRAALRHLQARQPGAAGHRGPRRARQRSAAAGPIRVRRQGTSARRPRQGRAAADRATDEATTASPAGSSSSKTTTSTSAVTWCRVSTSG